MKLFRIYSTDLFLKSSPLYCDIGSSNTRLMVGSKLVYSEPTCFALHTKSQAVLEYGEKAFRLVGKSTPDVELIFPVKNGQISSLPYFRLYLKVLKKSLQKHLFTMPSFIQGMRGAYLRPTFQSPAQRNHHKSALRSVGWGKLTPYDTAIASVRSLRGKNWQTDSYCLMDIGGDLTEYSIISEGKLVFSDHVYLGGVELTNKIQKFIESKLACAVGWQTAERIKIAIASILIESSKRQKPSQKKIVVRGKNVVTQAARTVTISSSDISELVSHFVEELIEEIQYFLSQLPSELVATVLKNGIYLTGGSSQIKDFDTLLADSLQTQVFLSQKAEFDGIHGMRLLAVAK